MHKNPEQLRVCLVAELSGGVGVYGQNLIRGLMSLGVVPTVLTPSPELAQGAPTIAVRKVGGRGRWLPQAKVFAIALHQLQGQTFDVVHFTDARFAVFARKTSAPIIGTMNDYFYALTGWWSGAGTRQVYEDWILRHIYYNITRMFERRCLRRLDQVLCISKAVKSILISRYGVGAERLPVVPYGIEYGSSEGEKIDKSGPIVLFAGGNFQRKGLGVLLDASPQILAENPGVTFVVLGDSRDAKLMRRRCMELGLEKAYRFLGQVDYASLYRYYRSADVYTMPSILEAFGIPFLEAMHCGVPVVASEVAGPDDYLVHGQNCWMARTGDPASLAEGINVVLQDEQLRCKLIENGQRTAAEHTVRKMAERTLEVYLRIAAGTRG